ncbi:MAG: polysaccharide deacetylase family protein [Clostridiales bacterium]|nr:polysaccharide deacetylase family protein [Clostridiales bacterium]
MSVKGKMAAATLLLMAAVLAGTAGILIQGDKMRTTVNNITNVTNKNSKDSADASADSPKIAITFDDGPHPYYTEQLLDGLKERGVRATFFVMGKQAEAYPELVKRMHSEGHLIGNHTYSHMQLGQENRARYIEELVKTNEVLREITGEETQYVRPPYGSWDKSIEAELTMFPVLWTIDPMDWCSDNVSCIVQKVISKAEENDIILLHDQYKTTVTAAFEIIDELTAQGYEFVTVDEILFD